MTILMAPKLFTVDDYHRMAAAGILRKEDRVELIEGEVVEMAPIGNRHLHVVDILTEMLARVARDLDYITRVQGSVKLNERSEPQPDIALLRRRVGGYRNIAALPRDVLLIVEVADSSLLYDQRVKAPLYGRHGIPETWIVNLPASTIEVYRNPSPDGYDTENVVRRGDHLTPIVIPSLRLAVDEIIGEEDS